MKNLIYDPAISGSRANIVCFVSGSGTNYREIVKHNPVHNYYVFTNRPGCDATEIARKNNHPVIELSHIPYLREARNKYGAGKAPRNSEQRIRYEQDTLALIEKSIGKQPDLICLAGYDLLNTDWLVDNYYPRILNVHPGDTAKGYIGLAWVASAKAIIAGDNEVLSTLFFVDKGEDDGPILLQSHPLNIIEVVQQRQLMTDFNDLQAFLRQNSIHDFAAFRQKADESQVDAMASICNALQNSLKEKGDWVIYPLAIQMITQGRVAMEGKQVYVNDRPLPVYGLRL
ncbi:MAG: formyltransferase family protein [Dehalococcoidales bacterium]|nr:formyltransferase family protein [Dehalococcoidales bacterium]